MDGSASQPMLVVGRYAVHGELAAGGMATVHFGRLLGSAGFARTVAIKRLHPQFARDPDFVSMFVDEARLAARIRHPNVVATIDVVSTAGELFLVMEYAPGESLARLVAALRHEGEPMPRSIAAAVVTGALHGLHAAHEARSERGQPLGMVHRDVSPQNVHVGVDGVARMLDFGVAKANERMQTTRDGQVKGKLAYMAPEQLQGNATRCTDVFAASIVLWEALAGQRLFNGDTEAEIIRKIRRVPIDPPSAHRAASSSPPGGCGDLADSEEAIAALDAIVLRGLERDPAKRFPTARDMALAIEEAVPVARPSEVGVWVERVAAGALAARAQVVAAIEAAIPTGSDARETESDLSEVAEDATKPALQVMVPDAGSAGSIVPVGATTPELGTSVPSPPASRWKRWRVAVAACAVGLTATATALVAASPRLEVPREPVLAAPGPSVASASAPPPAIDSSPAPTAPPPRRSSTPAWRPGQPTRVAGPNCSPPYVMDGAGHKHFRAECL